MKKILSFVLVFTVCICIAQEKYHRAKIHYNSPEQFIALLNKGVSLDHGYHKKNLFFESDFSDSDLKIVSQLGLNYDLIIEDVTNYYIKQNDPNSKYYVSPQTNLVEQSSCHSNGDIVTFPTPKNWNKGSMAGYFTYEEALQEIDDMYDYCKANGIDIITKRAEISNPNKPKDLVTYEGRKLQWVRISDNPNQEELNEPQILYTAVTHAREVMTIQETIFYMWFILENYTKNSEIKALVDNTEMYFIPFVNPDGYVYNQTKKPQGGGMWRKNRRGGYGVDNNRNYSYVKPNGTETWNSVGTSAKDGGTYAGTKPFSEPENRAIRYFVENHNFKISLNAHSYSNLLLFPFGYTTKEQCQDHNLFTTLAKHLTSVNNYDPKQSSRLYPHAGNSDDYIYGMLKTENGGTRDKVLAFTPEIGSQFWEPSNRIESICKQMATTNLMALKLATNYAVIKDVSNDNTDNTVFPVNFSLTRSGLHLSKDYKVSITPITSNIESVDDSKTISTIKLNETKTGVINLYLKNTIKSGDFFTFKLNLDNGYYTTSQTITKIFGSITPIFEDNGSSTDNWVTDSWGISKKQYKTSPSSITDSPNKNYENNAENTITLRQNINIEDLSIQDVKLTYSAQWNIKNNEDYVQIEASVDNGKNWFPLCGKYTNSGGKYQKNAENEPVYDGESSWVEESISLSDYIGQSFKLRFNLVSDNESNADGFYFDDLKVTTIKSGTLSNNGYTLDKLISIYPNPVKNRLTINTALTNYDFNLSNIQGQLLINSKSNSGNKTINYNQFAKGVYLLTVASKGKHKTFKIIKN